MKWQNDISVFGRKSSDNTDKLEHLEKRNYAKYNKMAKREMFLDEIIDD